jgi:adenosylhomocysteine nucleosidase
MSWQQLAAGWLVRQAKQSLWGAAMEAAHQAATVPDDGARTRDRAGQADRVEDDAAPRTCCVGIVFALAQEAGGLVDRMSGVTVIQGAGFVAREGMLRERRIVVIESGPGRAAASRATDALIAGHRPGWVISSGFAGGLHDDVRRGDIVMGESIVDESGATVDVDFKMDGGLATQHPRLRIGRLLTVDRIIGQPDEKRALVQQFDALAVDMETLAVAQACGRANVPFLSVRVISDAVGDRLPAEVDNLLRQKTFGGQMGAVAGALFRRPSSVRDLWRLKESALVASDELARFMECIVGELPPVPSTKQPS